ncbi:VOC family protein [Chloroflexota bacterium]
MAKETQLNDIDQIGIVVKDIDDAMKHYESLGFGPFERYQPVYKSRELYGKPLSPDVVTIKIAMGQIGPIQIELMQPVAEGTHWMEFLKTHGEGINHLGFFVDDVEKAEAEMLEKGYKIVYRSRFTRPDGGFGGASYFDTDKIGGVLIEPIQRPPST